MATGPGMTVDTIELRLVFRDDSDRLTLGDFSKRLAGLESLLALASMQGGKFGNQPPFISRQIVRRNTTVTYISYQSPLEIALSIGALIGSATLVAERLITLFERFQRARVLKAETDVQMLALRVILDEIDQVYKLPEGELRNRLLATASKTLSELEDIAIQ